ncbi:MAG: single-stranded-DNA-specific exonuclease RecJ [Fimbriimonadaceae bacterium]|nr:single-stranded-DNA-specific exonuclease RecJ [Fimbriimonadaceae bacterium]
MATDPRVAAQPAKWKIADVDPAAASHLADALGISRVLAKLLVQRGFSEPQLAERFLSPSLSDLHDPRQLPDYAAAETEILGAVERKELIYVHGDYDADGVTSTAILHRFLTGIGANLHAHVPHRLREGYGIHPEAVDRAAEMGAKLLLTCDCGVAAHEQVERARAHGLRVVVTDHHQPKETLPKAEAIVNPHRNDSIYPFTDLCGAGVVLKLVAGLFRQLGHEPELIYRKFLDLAVIGTVADMVPLVGENRVITKFGLPALTQSGKVGLAALKARADMAELPMTTTAIGFGLGPRINAVGRIDDAANALELLITTRPERADELAALLESQNQRRKEDMKRVNEEAIQAVYEDGVQDDFVLIVARDHWPPGIVGLAAGRVVEHFRRPAFVMRRDPDTGELKGSGRSIEGFHLANTIGQLSSLVRGGGHAAAAGCHFSESDLAEVRRRMDEIARLTLTEADFVPTVKIDLEVAASDVDERIMGELDRLQPYGMGNPEPMFLVRNLQLVGVKPMSRPEHVTVTFRSDSGLHRAIAFGIGERFSAVRVGATLDVVVRPEFNEWRGNREFRWNVKDFRLAAPRSD